MKTLKTVWHNIRRSPYQALAAIMVMMLTFLAVSFLTFLIFGSAKAISYFESKPQVTAFFRNDTKQSDINELETKLRDTESIASVKFVSKEDALKIYQEQNKNDPLLLDLVTADILPASLEISTVKISDLENVYQTLKSSPLIQEVIFQKDVVSTLTSWTSALRRVGLVLVIVLSLVSIFIIVTVVGVKVSQKKEDIEIMRLIGATNWYIRWPFILEGIFYGFIGAFLGWAVATVALLYSVPFLSSFLKGIPIFPVPLLFFAELLLAEFILAGILGAFSSFLAVLRYLK
ncbi:MAG: permease-like cell division protein FtsX [Candidatus Levybacteria bacterium]|nr:permease-like cell division protein FtsX [Candidatus Levybacteria bacterium]